MPILRPRGVNDGVEYIVVKRSGSGIDGRSSNVELGNPTRTFTQRARRSYTKRQDNLLDDLDSDSDDDDDLDDLPVLQGMPTVATIPTLTIPKGPPAFSMTVTVQLPDATAAPLADQDPAETLVVELVPPPKPSDGQDGGMSQTTEHLLIAAGSIGATIIIVLIVLALYTMRKRGLTFKDLMHPSQLRANYRGGPPPPPKYGHDSKQTLEENYAYARRNSVFPPVPAALNSRSNSISKEHTPLQTLGRTDSFANTGVGRKGSVDRSFYDDTISRSNSHRRVPSSPILPIQTMRRSDSTHNTRSQLDEDEAQFTNMPPRISPPAPPTFRQFLSNRPSASQRPGFGNAMMSRFSWTNSNAPQTPREARDTAMQPIGRDSFMTQRSSVPRFRTVDSWVNQQSNRVEEQKLKQQFRMTQSTVYSADGDEEEQIPKVPAVPAVIPESGGLAGKNIKHQRQDTTTSVMTAPIFKAHPGTEVRFSTRSTVPSEVLDLGNRNALSALSST